MKTSKQILILIAFIGIVIIHHIFGYVGHYGYDDLHYAKLANDFNNGIIDYEDHFSFRTPVILLTSLSYLIFGISDFSSALPAMLISSGILFLVYASLKEFGNTALVLGLTLTTLTDWFLFYSDKLMPDIYVALAIFGAVYAIHQFRYKNKGLVLSSILVNISLLFGFMCKGTIVLVIPVFLYYLIIDVLQKRNIRFWIFTTIGGVASLALYFTSFWALTGDFFKRFESIANNSYLNLCSYSEQSLGVLLKRLAYEFYGMLTHQGMAVGFIILLASLFRKKSLSLFKIQDSYSFWATSALILFLSSNFMSISLTSYSPMCLDPRHYLFLVPIISIPAALLVKPFLDNKTLKAPLILLTCLAAIYSYSLPGESFWQLYLPFALLVMIYSWLKPNDTIKYGFIGFMIIILLIKQYSMIEYAQKTAYRQQKKIFQEQIMTSNDSLLIITNDVQKRLGYYFLEFDPNSSFSLINYDEFENDTTDTRRKILYLNWHSRYLSNMSKNDLPQYAKNISSKNKLLFEDKSSNISIYDMNDFSVPEETGRLLIHSLNGFEKTDHENWKNGEVVSNQIKHNGTASNKMSEYSSSFELELNSLELENIDKVYIHCNAYCYYPESTSSKFVISIENENGAYIWEGIEINKYLKAYSNWWEVKQDLMIQKKDILPGSKLKVFMWNIDKQEAYLDDFEIQIIGE